MVPQLAESPGFLAWTAPGPGGVWTGHDPRTRRLPEPVLSATFAETGLEVDEALTQALARQGISTPTAVQAAAIPVVLAGKDAIIQSGTGTGKTLAYLLPLLQRARHDAAFRVVVLAPSPELAIQILRVAEAFKAPGLGSLGLVGSGSLDRQKEKLKKHPQIVVGTPGRVLELIFARKLKTATLGAMVLDEIDQILSPQNEAELRELCSRPEMKAQLVVASATFGRQGDAFARDYMAEDRVRLQLEASPLRETIRHRYHAFAAARDERELGRLLVSAEIDAALVFVHKAFWVPRLYHALNDQGLSCATLSAEASGPQRKEALEALKSRSVRALIATDAAARGLDVKDLGWVVHFELPNDKASYLHRAGRTGRSGKTGTSVVMITRDEEPALERLARELRLSFTQLASDRPGR
jgi:ATP-dependent RNA helicase DeaD